MSFQLHMQFYRFCIVGGVGFMIDGGVLWLLVWQGMEPLFARLFSFPLAVVATWNLNGRWTFRRPDMASVPRYFNLYLVTQLIGMVLNFGLYAAALWQLGTDQISTLLAFALGSFFALFWNFVAARYVLYLREDSPKGCRGEN